MQIAVIGLDLAKNVFEVHNIDDSGHAVLKRKRGVRELPACGVALSGVTSRCSIRTAC
jgi:transposase